MKKLTYQEFINLFPCLYFISDDKFYYYSGNADYPNLESYNDYKDRYEHFEKKYKTTKYTNQPIVYGFAQNISGVTGGNCWNDDSESYTNQIKELDLDFLYIKADISYSKVLRIKQLIQKQEFTEYEYYGNYNDILIQYIDIKKVYDIINED